MATGTPVRTVPVRTLPGRYYHDPAIFSARAGAHLFDRVGRADAIPDPDAFFLAAVGAENVIVLRDRRGHFRRGHRVADE